MARPKRSIKLPRRGRGRLSTADNDYQSGRYVCISMRRYSPDTGKMTHCKGCNVRTFDFEPEELTAIILRAIQGAAAEHQAIRKGER